MVDDGAVVGLHERAREPSVGRHRERRDAVLVRDDARRGDVLDGGELDDVVRRAERPGRDGRRGRGERVGAVAPRRAQLDVSPEAIDIGGRERDIVGERAARVRIRVPRRHPPGEQHLLHRGAPPSNVRWPSNAKGAMSPARWCTARTCACTSVSATSRAYDTGVAGANASGAPSPGPEAGGRAPWRRKTVSARSSAGGSASDPRKNTRRRRRSITNTSPCRAAPSARATICASSCSSGNAPSAPSARADATSDARVSARHELIIQKAMPLDASFLRAPSSGRGDASGAAAPQTTATTTASASVRATLARAPVLIEQREVRHDEDLAAHRRGARALDGRDKYFEHERCSTARHRRRPPRRRGGRLLAHADNPEERARRRRARRR